MTLKTLDFILCLYGQSISGLCGLCVCELGAKRSCNEKKGQEGGEVGWVVVGLVGEFKLQRFGSHLVLISMLRHT